MPTPSPNEIWLALDLSSSHGTVSLHRFDGKNESPVWSGTLEEGSHSESLLPSLYMGLEESQIEVPQIARFVTTDGPGSFTGLRIAASTLQAFSLSTQKPIEVVSGPEIRALSWLERSQKLPPTLAVTTHGTLSKFTLTCFKVESATKLRMSEQRSVSVTDLTCFDPFSVVLTDRASSAYLSAHLKEKESVVALSSSSLARHLLNSPTRKTFLKLEELSALTPQYVGSERFN